MARTVLTVDAVRCSPAAPVPMFDDPDQLLTIVQALGLLLLGLDRAGAIVTANARCEAMAGTTAALLVGRRWTDVFIDEGRRERADALSFDLAPGAASPPLVALFGPRRMRWIAVRTSTGNGAYVLGEDITDASAARASRRARERVAALATMSAGFSHELRNPLNSATLQLEVLGRKLARHAVPEAEALVPYVTAASSELRRAAALLDDFVAYARPHPLTAQATDVGQIVRKAVDRAAGRAAESGVVIGCRESTGVVAELDAGRVEGAVFNLLANAIDAVAGHPSPIVAVGWAADATRVLVEVRDNGPGLPSKDAPIFDPFFTTKPFGTGLGLAIVERVALDHGGSIAVERLAETTVFRLGLPIVHGNGH